MDKVFKPVPLQLVLQASKKLDPKAIYRRQRRAIGPFDEEILLTGPDGLPLWDLTTPLPVRRHEDWMRRGFEYVTLASIESLEMVAPLLKENGLDVREFVFHRHFGPWNPKLYAATAEEGDRLSVVRILDALDTHGVQAYEDITGTPLNPAMLQAWQARKAHRAGTTATVKAGDTALAGNDGTVPAAAPTPAPRKPRPRAAKPAKGEPVGAKP